MNEQELKEFIAWFSKSTGIEDQAILEKTLSEFSEDEMKQVLGEYNKYKQIKIAKQGMKIQCPKGEMPKYFKVGGVVKQCGCKKIEKPTLTEEVTSKLKEGFLKCGGKMKKKAKK